MDTFFKGSAALLIFLLLLLLCHEYVQGDAPVYVVKLPAPRYDGATSIEKALRSRRSIGEYAKDSLTLAGI